LPYDEFKDWVANVKQWGAALYCGLATNLPFPVMRFFDSIEGRIPVGPSQGVSVEMGDAIDAEEEEAPIEPGEKLFLRTGSLASTYTNLRRSIK
jgi:hypothetical protein